MGYSNWSDEAFADMSRSRSSRGGSEIFRGDKSIDPLMDPRGLTFREARDSEHHPNSVPIIVAFDVTGSMGSVPTRFAQTLLGRFMKLITSTGWVTDPQVCFLAIGDAVSDRAPLQVGQFESGLEMDAWLTRIWLEGKGGDHPESYQLAHWFAAHHTRTDAWEKRKAKGYLFTIGDAPNKPLSDSQIHRVFGSSTEHPTSERAVINAAKERWHCVHVHLTHGRDGKQTLGSWRKLLPKGLVMLSEVDAICELMGTAIGLCEGTLDADAARSILTEAGMDPEEIAPMLAQLA